MPIIRARGVADRLAPVREALIERLVEDLLGQGGYVDPPLIFETAATCKVIDVIVIWDAWRAVPNLERGEIIVQAYTRLAAILARTSERADQPPWLPRRSGCLAGTKVEALQFGYLPYVIRADRNRVGDPDQLTLLQAEFDRLGALDSGDSLTLHLPDEPMRRDALEQLTARFPGVAFQAFDLDFDT